MQKSDQYKKDPAPVVYVSYKLTEEHFILYKQDGIISLFRHRLIQKPQKYSRKCLYDEQQRRHTTQSEGPVKPDRLLADIHRMQVERKVPERFPGFSWDYVGHLDCYVFCKAS